MIRWIFLSIVLLGLCVASAIFGKASNYGSFEATLIGVNITVSILAINFSFVAYQNSEYRQFQRGLSSNLLLGCLCVLICGMSPAMSLVFFPRYVGIISIAALPLIALFSVGLVGLAKWEASPSALIRHLRGKRRQRRALRKFGSEIKENKSIWENYELISIKDMPMHEWNWIPLPPVHWSDPFSTLGTIGCMAAKGGKVDSLVQVTDTLLNALDLGAILLKKRKDVPREVLSIIKSQLEKLVIAAETADETGYASARFLDACAAYLGRKSTEKWPSADLCFFVAALMVKMGERWLKKGHPSIAKTPLIVVRLLCLKGVDRSLKEDQSLDHVDSLFWVHNINGLAQMLKPLGSHAIEVGASDYLYRVFDAYGWLGCSCVKANERDIAATCIRALAQLGREARSKKLECHSERCAIRPEDHAKERIEWITSWILQAPEQTKKGWLELCSQGLSRLTGNVVKLGFSEREGKPIIEFGNSEEPHKEMFDSNGVCRELDYSEHDMLKDFELYGIMGSVLMQGPFVPFQKSE